MDNFTSMKPNVKYQIPNVRGNQKAIRVHRMPSDSENFYSKFNIESLTLALQYLSANAFKLWAWFTKNVEGYSFALSGAAAREACQFSKSTYERCVNELIEKGYLRKGVLFSNFTGYVFVEGGPLMGITQEEQEFSGAAAPVDKEKQGLE